MFAYCLNNPATYVDLSGEKVIGFGLQIDVQGGDVCAGIEVIIYFDPEVCNGEDIAVVMYTYSGSSISMNDLASLSTLIAKESVMIITEMGDENQDAILLAMKGVLDGFSLSGSVFLLDANDSFKSYSDYSGPFDSYSGSVNVKGVEATAFVSTCDTCTAYGLKAGVSSNPKKWFLPVDISYSRTTYSEPTILWEGSL